MRAKRNWDTGRGPLPRRLARLSSLACAMLLAMFLTASTLGGDDLDARRAKIASMSPAEQQELLRKQERFAALPAEEQSRLRALQSALDKDPESTRLHQVLVRYHEWLKTLTASQRAELADLAPEARIEKIKKLQHQQRVAQEHGHRSERLSRQDLLAVIRWAEDLTWKSRERLLGEMPKSVRARLEKSDTQWQRHAVLFKAYEQARHDRGAELAKVTQEDIDQLSGKLSEAARAELTKAPDLAARRKLVGGWIGMALHRGSLGAQSRKMSPLVGEDLMQFLENEVPAAERERLLKLPREQMMEELRGMYFARTREAGPFGFGPGWGEGKSFDRSKGRFGGPKGGRAPGRPSAGNAKEPAPVDEPAKTDKPAQDDEPTKTDKPGQRDDSPAE